MNSEKGGSSYGNLWMWGLLLVAIGVMVGIRYMRLRGEVERARAAAVAEAEKAAKLALVKAMVVESEKREQKSEVDGDRDRADSRAESESIEAAAPASGRCAVRVAVEGLSPIAGTIRVAVFEDGATFPDHKRALKTASRKVDGERSVVEVVLEEGGGYAVAVYHDVNDDGVLNKTAFGMPTEPYGFSKDARGTYGPPSFEQAKVEIGEGGAELVIGLK